MTYSSFTLLIFENTSICSKTASDASNTKHTTEEKIEFWKSTAPSFEEFFCDLCFEEAKGANNGTKERARRNTWSAEQKSKWSSYTRETALILMRLISFWKISRQRKKPPRETSWRRQTEFFPKINRPSPPFVSGRGGYAFFCLVPFAARFCAPSFCCRFFFFEASRPRGIDTEKKIVYNNIVVQLTRVWNSAHPRRFI